MDAQSESPHQISIRNNICLTYPDNWKIVDIKQIFDVHNGSTPKSSVDAYWNGDISWITPADMVESKYIEKSSRFITSEGFHSCNLTMADPGDIVISCRAPIGSINIVSRPMCTNQGCKLLKPKCEIDTSFYYYFLCSQKDVLNSLGRGTTFMELSTDDLNNYTVPLPDVEIQHRIVSFLDFKCGNLNDIIKYNESIIDELSNLKQSIISETVTRGLDPNASLKDSGIPWIGMIPFDWKISRIKNMCTLRGRIGWQGLKASEFTDEGPYVITGTDFSNGRIDWDTCNRFSESRFEEDFAIHVKEGDLLITKDGTVGKVAIAVDVPEKVSLNSGVMLIRPFVKFNRNYLRYVLISNQFWNWYNSNQRGNSTIKHLYQEQFYDFKFALPPEDVQDQISTYLDSVCSSIDSQIQTYQDTIFKLNDYRLSIIYEYVTGKRSISGGIH